MGQDVAPSSRTAPVRDAFARGKNINKPAVGYKLIPVTGDDGQPVIDADGRLVTE